MSGRARPGGGASVALHGAPHVWSMLTVLPSKHCILSILSLGLAGTALLSRPAEQSHTNTFEMH
eukprot:4813524-Amphidinium_carterae.1